MNPRTGITWAAKDPNEVRSYELNWQGRVLPATIVSQTLVVDRPVSTSAVLSGIVLAGYVVSVVASGGADGSTTHIIATCVTSDGQTLEESIYLPVVSSVVLNAGPTTARKRVICEMAYEFCGIGSYEFNITAAEWAARVRSLDTLMARWQTQGIEVNYRFPDAIGAGDIDDMSGLPDFAVQAAALDLAEIIAPSFGKALPREVVRMQSEAKTALYAATMLVPVRQVPSTYPIGSGNKPWSVWWPYPWSDTGNSGSGA